MQEPIDHKAALLAFATLMLQREELIKNENGKPTFTVDAQVEAVEDQADAVWYGTDETGRNLLRWFGAAWERLKDYCEKGEEVPPWLRPGSSQEHNREALAGFFRGSGHSATGG